MKARSIDTLPPVAVLAKQLQVLQAAAAAPGERNHVVDLQVLPRTAFHAAPLVAQQDAFPFAGRKMIAAGRPELGPEVSEFTVRRVGLVDALG